jgi:adenine-specific DNA glycosylase
VASIAYGVRVPALDANNLRVWSRLLATSDKKRISRVFHRIIPGDRPGDFNQALMDLGSTVCTPRNAECTQCPLVSWCRAYKLGEVDRFPLKKKTPATTSLEVALGIIFQREKILVQKRADKGLFPGMWEFPGGKIGEHVNEYVRESVSAKKERTKQSRSYAHTLNAQTHVRESVDAEKQRTTDRSAYAPTLHADTDVRNHGITGYAETPEEAVVREVREETGLRIQVCEKLGVFTHTYTRFRVKLHVFVCRRKTGRLTNHEARWVTLEELEALPMPSANRRIVGKLEEHLDTETRGRGDTGKKGKLVSG